MKALVSTAFVALVCAFSGAASAHNCHCADMPPPPPPPPALPAPPAPPAPPALPAIPAAAHQLCIGKADGTLVQYAVRAGAVMTGTCAHRGSTSTFRLQSYLIEDEKPGSAQ